MISIMETNELLPGTVTDSGALSAQPATNVLNEQPTVIARFTGAGPHHIIFEMPSAVTVIQAFAGYHNGASGDTWDLLAAAAAASLPGSPAFSETGLVLTPNPAPLGFSRFSSLAHLSASQSFAAWCFRFNVSVDPFDIGICFAGDPFIPSRGADFGIQVAYVEPSGRTRTPSGTVYPNARGKHREGSMVISYLPESEARGRAAQIERLAGTSRPVVIADAPDSQTYTMEQSFYSLLTGSEPFSTERGFPDGGRRYRHRYVFEEWELP